jgi:hypothetical protein
MQIEQRDGASWEGGKTPSVRTFCVIHGRRGSRHDFAPPNKSVLVPESLHILHDQHYSTLVVIPDTFMCCVQISQLMETQHFNQKEGSRERRRDHRRRKRAVERTLGEHEQALHSAPRAPAASGDGALRARPTGARSGGPWTC